MQVGKPEIARRKLEQSIEELSQEYPNPLEYRSRIALSEALLREGNPAKALEHAGKALEQVQGYLPALDLMCRASAEPDPGRALESCRAIVEAGVASAGAELAFAVLHASDVPTATEAILRARTKGAEIAQLQAAIGAVDPSLFRKLGVPKPRR